MTLLRVLGELGAATWFSSVQGWPMAWLGAGWPMLLPPPTEATGSCSCCCCCCCTSSCRRRSSAAAADASAAASVPPPAHASSERRSPAQPTPKDVHHRHTATLASLWPHSSAAKHTSVQVHPWRLSLPSYPPAPALRPPSLLGPLSSHNYPCCARFSDSNIPPLTTTTTITTTYHHHH
eukprot:361939-Chlamydomonas_euryale.AAC.1